MGSRFRDLKVKLINFWKRNKRKLLVIFFIWLIVIVINTALKNRPEKVEAPITTYTPEKSVMDENKTVPKEKQQAINDIVDRYFNYCNNKQYEEAYNMIADTCKKTDYTSLEIFKEYVDYVFGDKKKIYNLQSYSIVDNKYVYNIRILDDILATGTSEPFYYNGEYYDGYYYYEEKITLIDENGEMKLLIGQTIEQQDTNILAEDDYIKVKVSNKVTDYDSEKYTVQIDNKTNKYIVIYDGSQNNEIIMDYDGLEAKPLNQTASIVIAPNSFVVREIRFSKYYDDGRKASTLKFGAIRVLNEYDYNQKTTQENLDNAVKLYSFEIPMK